MDRLGDRLTSLLRQFAHKTIELPIGGGRTISWLELQAIFLFVCCLVCSCCSLGSYLWGCVRLDQGQSASINAPRPTRTTQPTPGVADAGTVPVAATPTRASTATHTPRPTGARPLATPTQWTPPSPTSTAASTQAPTEPPAQTDTPPPMPPTPTSTPTMTPTPTETPAASPTPTHTAQPTSTPTDTPTPTPLPSDVRITHVEYSPPADPLVDEYVMIENRGFGSQDMTGWTLSDDNWNTYFFPPGFVLPGGESVLVWTTSGTDTDEHLYWGRGDPVWGNQNDTAYLRDSRAAVVDSVSW